MKSDDGFFSDNEIKLLSELSKDSSQSNGGLGVKLGIHLTTVRRLKKALEEKIGLKYVATFDPSKVPSYRLFYVLQKLSPGVRDNEEISRKMEKYYLSKSYIISYGRCIHSKWDCFALFYCNEKLFDEYFGDYKSRVDLMSEELDVIKVGTFLPCGFSKPPIDSVVKKK